jgi:hypothetical protein
MRGGAAQRIGMMTEPDRDVRAPGVEEPRRDQGIAAVAAAPGQNEHLLAARIANQHLLARPRGDRVPGQLHQLRHADAEIDGHDPIDLGHLVRGDGRYWRLRHRRVFLAVEAGPRIGARNGLRTPGV